MKFEQYAQEANLFVKEVASELNNEQDRDHAYRVLTAVLHTIREIITPEESLHLVSQLPMYLKAVYVNEWTLRVRERIRSLNEFLECLRSKSGQTAARDFGNNHNAVEKTKAVLSVLRRHVSTGELQDIIDQFPVELAGLWITDAREKEQVS